MLQLLTRTIDARPLAWCRILVGIASLPITLEWLFPLVRVASGKYVALPVFGVLGPLSSTSVLVLVSVSVIASLTMIIGIAGRLPSLLVAACAAVAILSDQQAYSNHLLLLVMLSMFIGLSGASKAISVRGIKKTEMVPYWPAFLIKMQVTTLYAWSAIAKINPQFLAGDVIGANLHPWVPIPGGLLPVVSIASIAAEAFLAVALWVPRFRLVAFVVGAGLHVGIIVTLQHPAPLIPFAMMMLSGYVLFAHDSVRNGQWNLMSHFRRAIRQTAAPTT